MQWILQFIIRHRNISSLFLTVMLSLWMLSSNPARQQQIGRSLTLTLFFPFQYTFQLVTRIRNIFAENRRLRAELTELRTTASFLAEQAAENGRLREMLALRDSVSYELVAARVIAREPSYLYRSLVINAGGNRDIVPNMPVVTHRGVVGKVIQIMPYISLVQTLQDPSARTSVMTSRSRSVGILETEDGGTFSISHRRHADVAPGDTVVTTGLGGIYPKGLLVGYVTKVEEGSDPLFKKTILRLSVDFDHLEELFVLKLSPQWRALTREIESLEMGK